MDLSIDLRLLNGNGATSLPEECEQAHITAALGSGTGSVDTETSPTAHLEDGSPFTFSNLPANLIPDFCNEF